MKDLSEIGLDVSRETIDLLADFEAMVLKWNKHINLISRADAQNLWSRHIADSAQVFQVAGDGSKWLDIGSGGGFPGIVVAILSRESHSKRHITLVESDKRKAVFLRAVGRDLKLSITVLPDRIEDVPPQGADIISARALADIPALMGFAEKHLVRSGTAIFPKGKTWQSEVNASKPSWQFTLEAIKSRTNPEAALLKIRDIRGV